MRRGIRLRERGDASLEEDLGFGKVGGLFGEVGVADTGFVGGDVGQLAGGEIDGKRKLILAAADDGLGVTEFGNGVGEGVDGRFGGGLGGDAGGGAGADGGGTDDRPLAADAGGGAIGADGHFESAQRGDEADAVIPDSRNLGVLQRCRC